MPGISLEKARRGEDTDGKEVDAWDIAKRAKRGEDTYGKEVDAWEIAREREEERIHMVRR